MHSGSNSFDDADLSALCIEKLKPGEVHVRPLRSLNEHVSISDQTAEKRVLQQPSQRSSSVMDGNSAIVALTTTSTGSSRRRAPWQTSPEAGRRKSAKRTQDDTERLSTTLTPGAKRLAQAQTASLRSWTVPWQRGM